MGVKVAMLAHRERVNHKDYGWPAAYRLPFLYDIVFNNNYPFPFLFFTLVMESRVLSLRISSGNANVRRFSMVCT